MSNDLSEQTSPSWPEFEDPELLERIIDIIAKEGVIDREKITPDATLETLGLASMDVVMILMGVEEQLDAYIPIDGDLSSARTLSEFIAAIVKAMKAGGPPQSLTTEPPQSTATE